MRTPSVEKLCASFRDLSASDARLLKRVCGAVAVASSSDEPSELARLVAAGRLPATDRYVRSLASDPYRSRTWRSTVALHACNELLGMSGVESLGGTDNPGYAPDWEYLNAGDTYATTLVYRLATDTIRISCMGSIVEQFDPKGEW